MQHFIPTYYITQLWDLDAYINVSRVVIQKPKIESYRACCTFKLKAVSTYFSIVT